MKKKWIALALSLTLLAATMLPAYAAEEPVDSVDEPAVTAAEPAAAPEAETAPEQTAEPTEAPAPEATPDEDAAPEEEEKTPETELPEEATPAPDAEAEETPAPEQTPAPAEETEETPAPTAAPAPSATPKPTASPAPSATPAAEKKADAVDEEDLETSDYAAIREVRLDRSNIELKVGEKATLYATILPNYATADRTLYWSSSDSSVVGVRATGPATAEITAYKMTGHEWITVRTSNGRTASCQVVIKEGGITSVTLDRQSADLNKGQGLQLYAAIHPDNASGDRTLQWTSSNSEVATVNNYGYVYAIGAGDTTITVRSANGCTASCAIKVRADLSRIYSFVYQLYNYALDRQPDQPGLDNWVNALYNGNVTGLQAANGFVFSPEFQNKNYCNEHYVDHLYYIFLGRAADAPGRADWVSRLESGQTREAVFNGFAGSSEFANFCAQAGIRVGGTIPLPAYGTVPHGSCSACGKPDGVTTFVKRLYNVCLDREAEPAGLADWTNRLWNHTASGRDVAYGFIFSREFQGKGYNDDTYIEYLYKAFFDRRADAAGKADWLNRMHRLGWSRVQVFQGFVGSQEFVRLCARYGIVRG